MFFSVIIPLYNKGYSIERAVSSILNQSYRNFEIIVVDDGSTDDSMVTLNEKFSMQISDGLIKVINQENKGVSSARNNGVNIAKYEYICFLDADDEWEFDFLYKMKCLINDFPMASLFCLAHKVYKNNLPGVIPRHGLPNDYRGYVNDFFLASSKGSVAKSSKVCVKKNRFTYLGGFPNGISAGEDLCLWIKLGLDSPVACDMHYCVNVYIINDFSRGARKISIPYPFIMFSKKLIPKNQKSLKKYLFRIFYKHFGDSIINYKFKEAFMRLYYYMLMNLNQLFKLKDN